MKHQIASLIKDTLKDLGFPDVTVEVTAAEDAAHGDYTTNVAMKVWRSPQSPSPREASAKWGQLPKSPQFRSPMDLALQVKEAIRSQLSAISQKNGDQNIVKRGQKQSDKKAHREILSAIDRVEVAPPGFLNVFLTEANLITSINRLLKLKEGFPIGNSKQGEGIMVEYGDPNTHKAFHIGHLRNITIGESVVRLLEAVGADVVHASYQGDVGMHIAKCVYALLHIDEIRLRLDTIRTSDVHAKVDFLGKAYAAGSATFENSDEAKKEIGVINKKIYARDSDVYPLYLESRQWSLDYFETIYQRVGTVYRRNYFESEVYESGKRNVLEGLKNGIFEESEGAIIFPGKKFGLHNRVFITKEGNPTYEGKDMGLGPLQYGDLAKWTKKPVLVIRIVGPEQAGYFQVVFEAHSQLFPELRDKFYHLIAGWVKLKHGKMSSRSGNVVLGEWLLDEAKKSIYTILDKTPSISSSPISPLSPKLPLSSGQKEEIAEKAAVAAVKYAFLRVGTMSEIAFDMETSVSFDGDSGPYLQYTYARCRSVLRRASDKRQATGDKQNTFQLMSHVSGLMSLNAEERAVARLLTFFPDVVADAANNLSPSTLCTYLFKLAATFNVFYAKHSILGGDTQQETRDKQEGNCEPSIMSPVSGLVSLRLALTAATAHVLSHGLYLLGIEALEQM